MVKSVQERNRESQERQPTTREGYSPPSEKIKKHLTNQNSCVIIKIQKRDMKEVMNMMKFFVEGTNPANPWHEVIEVSSLESLEYYQNILCGGAQFIIDFENKKILVLD